MTSANEESNQQGLPGNRIKKLAHRSRVMRSVLTHVHVLQIVDDHQAMWLEAKDAADKKRIEVRLRKQLALASVNFLGFEITLHGAVAATFSDPAMGGWLILTGIVLMHVTRR